MDKNCAACGKEDPRHRCSACHQFYYCDAACQLRGWPLHKKLCTSYKQTWDLCRDEQPSQATLTPFTGERAENIKRAAAKRGLNIGTGQVVCIEWHFSSMYAGFMHESRTKEPAMLGTAQQMLASMGVGDDMMARGFTAATQCEGIGKTNYHAHTLDEIDGNLALWTGVVDKIEKIFALGVPNTSAYVYCDNKHTQSVWGGVILPEDEQ